MNTWIICRRNGVLDMFPSDSALNTPDIEILETVVGTYWDAAAAFRKYDPELEEPKKGKRKKR